MKKVSDLAISSAGVVGPQRDGWIDEQTRCHPSNTYEQSKWDAEQYLQQLSGGKMRICMLRPTNVIDESRPGMVALPLRDDWRDRVACFIKGGECAHLVHASDVAAAAIYTVINKACHGAYFVGYDEDEKNTVSGVYKTVREQVTGNAYRCTCLPVGVPFYMRRLIKGESLHGKARFSSARLLSTGFTFPLGFGGAVRNICLQKDVITT
ncbi:MAG: NAD(P)-dependent oxidoreductase [Mariprofundales bacterium]